jgi:hypothetical protein
MVEGEMTVFAVADGMDCCGGDGAWRIPVQARAPSRGADARAALPACSAPAGSKLC